MAEDHGPAWNSPGIVLVGANSHLVFRLLKLMVEKDIISQAEAASVFVDTANDVRSGAEDGPQTLLGETMATTFENLAALCLGRPIKL